MSKLLAWLIWARSFLWNMPRDSRVESEPPQSLTVCDRQVEGLQAGRPYQLRVRAANARGSGNWSEPTATATAPAPPPAPAPPTFGNRTVSSVRARWDLPEDDNGSAVNRYRCECIWCRETSHRASVCMYCKPFDGHTAWEGDGPPVHGWQCIPR